jgi:hypothetical protein
MEERLYIYGDRVKIIECYHPMWKPGGEMIDLQPEKVGKEGVIAGFIQTQGKWSYSIHFDGGKSHTSWFQTWQIEKLHNPLEEQCQSIYNQAIDHAINVVKQWESIYIPEELIEQLKSLKTQTTNG